MGSRRRSRAPLKVVEIGYPFPTFDGWGGVGSPSVYHSRVTYRPAEGHVGSISGSYQGGVVTPVHHTWPRPGSGGPDITKEYFDEDVPTCLFYYPSSHTGRTSVRCDLIGSSFKSGRVDKDET